jgi:hypothetical protein
MNSDLLRIFLLKDTAVGYFKVTTQHFPESNIDHVCFVRKALRRVWDNWTDIKNILLNFKLKFFFENLMNSLQRSAAF